MKRLIACGAIVLASTTGCRGPEDAAPFADETAATEALTGAPRYDLSSDVVLGEYTSDEGCPGGFDACERVVVRRSGAKVEVSFGFDAFGSRSYIASAWSDGRVILFSTGDITDGDCDDPGCGNLVRMSGVIYPVRVGQRWVPQVKATYAVDFPFPDEPDAPDGEVRTTIRLKRS